MAKDFWWLAREVDQLVRISSSVFCARRDWGGGAGPVVLAVCCCVDPDVAAAVNVGAAVVEVLALKRPPVDPDVVVGAAVVDVDVDVPACVDGFEPRALNSEGGAVPVPADCVEELDVPAGLNKEGAAVAVAVPWFALELCPLSENPVKGVEEGAVVAAVFAACEVPGLVLLPPRGANRPPLGAVCGLLEVPCPAKPGNKLVAPPACEVPLVPLCCAPRLGNRLDDAPAADEAAG